jgi:hypothetical protein
MPMSALDALLEEPGLVHHQHAVSGAKMRGSAGADIVANPSGVPGRRVQQPLHPVRRRVPGRLSQRPPALGGQRALTSHGRTRGPAAAARHGQTGQPPARTGHPAPPPTQPDDHPSAHTEYARTKNYEVLLEYLAARSGSAAICAVTRLLPTGPMALTHACNSDTSSRFAASASRSTFSCDRS